MDKLVEFGMFYGILYFPRIGDIDAETREVFDVARDEGKVVMKGCCRNYAIHDCQGKPCRFAVAANVPAFGYDFRDRHMRPANTIEHQYQASPATRCAFWLDWKRGDALTGIAAVRVGVVC